MSPDLVMYYSMYVHQPLRSLGNWNNGAQATMGALLQQTSQTPISLQVAGDTSTDLVSAISAEGNGWESVGTGIMNVMEQ